MGNWYGPITRVEGGCQVPDGWLKVPNRLRRYLSYDEIPVYLYLLENSWGTRNRRNYVRRKSVREMAKEYPMELNRFHRRLKKLMEREIVIRVPSVGDQKSDWIVRLPPAREMSDSDASGVSRKRHSNKNECHTTETKVSHTGDAVSHERNKASRESDSPLHDRKTYGKDISNNRYKNSVYGVPTDKPEERWGAEGLKKDEQEEEAKESKMDGVRFVSGKLPAEMEPFHGWYPIKEKLRTKGYKELAKSTAVWDTNNVDRTTLYLAHVPIKWTPLGLSAVAKETKVLGIERIVVCRGDQEQATDHATRRICEPAEESDVCRSLVG